MVACVILREITKWYVIELFVLSSVHYSLKAKFNELVIADMAVGPTQPNPSFCQPKPSQPTGIRIVMTQSNPTRS